MQAPAPRMPKKTATKKAAKPRQIVPEYVSLSDPGLSPEDLALIGSQDEIQPPCTCEPDEGCNALPGPLPAPLPKPKRQNKRKKDTSVGAVTTKKIKATPPAAPKKRERKKKSKEVRPTPATTAPGDTVPTREELMDSIIKSIPKNGWAPFTLTEVGILLTHLGAGPKDFEWSKLPSLISN